MPQGDNLPTEWQDMLGGREEAARAQDEHRHKLGNLTVTQFNSNLGNKSFQEKRDRKDSEGRFIGYQRKSKYFSVPVPHSGIIHSYIQ